jgi:RNA polymerase sigma-70 factor (ECF subfamily)
MTNTTLKDSSATCRLIDSAAGGDAVALNDLMSRHADSLQGAVRRRLGRKLAGRVDPSDIVQEAQKTVLERFADYCRRRPMPFRLWLLRTAHERIVDAEREHLHAQKRAVDREMAIPDASSFALASELLASTPGPERQAMRKEVAQQIRRCLALLSEPDREILMFRCFEGLNNREVATLLELKPETTKKRFTRALLRMRRVLNDAGISDIEIP